MQDRYVGDVGDYAKYSLLKALSGASGDTLRLGVLWYLFPDEGHNGDGRHTAYLKLEAMAARDPVTHSLLSELVQTGRRSVAAVEKSCVLPSNTIFYDAPVAVAGSPLARSSYRREWFRAGLSCVGSADVLFFDPDNGVETPALKKSDFKAGKYVFWEEIEDGWRNGKSLVIYNHLNRSASAAMQTSRLQTMFENRLTGAAAVIPLLFRRGSCRHLWIIAQPTHVSRLVRRTRAFLECGWHADTEVRLPA